MTSSPLPSRERVAPDFSQGSGESAGGGPREGRLRAAPRVLVTGFGPFPNAPENPTEALVRRLANRPPEGCGAGALRALVLPTEYRRSWPALRRVQTRFGPDIVVHFGLAMRTDCIRLERVARNRVAPDRPDAAGFAPKSGLARRSGPEALSTTLPVEAIQLALVGAGFPTELSEDAGAYVCNATLYRSVCAVPAGSKRLVGFVHVPPEDTGGFTQDRLHEAARLILTTTASLWAKDSGRLR